MDKKVLIGNSFPLTLVRGRTVTINEVKLDELLSEMDGAKIYSFWGHENTRKSVESYLGISLATYEERPQISLSKNNLPSLYDVEFNACWVVSPNQIDRHAVSQNFSLEEIGSWTILKLSWE